MNTEMICQSCTLIYREDICMDIKELLEETECADRELVIKIENIKDAIKRLNSEITSLIDERIALNENCHNAIFDELLKTAKDENVKVHLKVLRRLSEVPRYRERCLDIAIDSNIANIEVGSVVADIPHFNVFKSENGCKIYTNEMMFSLLYITTLNDIVTEITTLRR